MERIKTYDGVQFTSKEFQESLCVHGVRIALAASDHQEMNGQVKVIWKKLQNIAHSIMVHARVSDEYMHLN